MSLYCNFCKKETTSIITTEQVERGTMFENIDLVKCKVCENILGILPSQLNFKKEIDDFKKQLLQISNDEIKSTSSKLTTSFLSFIEKRNIKS